MQSSELMGVIVVFGFTALMVYLSGRQKTTRIRYRADVQKELIAKFATASELAEFLKSEAGRSLIHDSTPEAQPASPPKTAKQLIGEAMTWGVLALAVGSAIVIVNGLTLTGAVFIAIGIGFEINALLIYVFSKKWGGWDVPAGPAAPRDHVG